MRDLFIFSSTAVVDILKKDMDDACRYLTEKGYQNLGTNKNQRNLVINIENKTFKTVYDRDVVDYYPCYILSLPTQRWQSELSILETMSATHELIRGLVKSHRDKIGPADQTQ